MAEVLACVAVVVAVVVVAGDVTAAVDAAVVAVAERRRRWQQTWADVAVEQAYEVDSPVRSWPFAPDAVAWSGGRQKRLPEDFA